MCLDGKIEATQSETHDSRSLDGGGFSTSNLGESVVGGGFCPSSLADVGGSWSGEGLLVGIMLWWPSMPCCGIIATPSSAWVFWAGVHAR